MPKISCIMPVYNTVDYLEECIESILNQSFTDFEFIISDDGSTDGSKDIIKKYAKQDSRIIFLDNKKNRGICANLNDMIKIANGEYIAIMESDDISLLKRFEIQLNEFNKDKKVKLIGGQGGHIDETSKIILEKFPNMNYNFTIFNQEHLFRNTFVAPTVMYNIDLHKKIEKFEYDVLWDFYFYSNVLGYGYKCKNIKECLSYKRVHSESLGATKIFKIRNLYFYLSLKILNKFNIKNKEIAYLKTFYHLFRGYFFAIIITLTKKIGIYKKISFLYRKYILNYKND